LEIHLEPVVYIARLFTDGRSFTNPKDEFDAVMTVHRMGDIALLSGLHGMSLTGPVHEELMAKLKEIGVRQYYCTRKGIELCRGVP
jgi:hypothetical protein